MSNRIGFEKFNLFVFDFVNIQLLTLLHVILFNFLFLLTNKTIEEQRDGRILWIIEDLSILKRECILE